MLTSCDVQLLFRIIYSSSKTIACKLHKKNNKASSKEKLVFLIIVG